MAVLSAEEFVNRILKPKNRKNIDNAVFQEERLLLHGEAILEKYNLPYTAFYNFTMWWQTLVSPSKHDRIDQLMNCPLFTVGVFKDVFDDLQKFLDAQDRYVDFEFSDIDFTNDYNAYLQKTNDDDFWRGEILRNLKTGICSYVVIDLPAEQKSERPEPYNYFVAPRLITDVDINQFTGNVEYICFRQPDFNWDESYNQISTPSALASFKQNEISEKVICIDDNTYRVFAKPKNVGTRSGVDWTLLSEVEHGLGYCPCIDFWKDSIKGTNRINKIGPVTLQLSNLDYLLFFKACIDYMNLYGPFPPMITYDMKGNNFDDKSRQQLTGSGGAYARNQTSSISNSKQVENAKNSGSNLIGPGGGFTVPVPADSTDHDFMKNPMKFVGMDVANVKQANELLEQFEANFKEKCTGIDKDYMNEIAKNGEMIAASFRKEESILSWIKGNIERVHKFVTKTKCELRYGVEYYLGCTIDYGSDYLLKDATTLSNEFKEASDNGMPQGYTFEIAHAAAITRFKNNPEKLARMRILFDLEPYATMSWTDIFTLGLNVSDKDNFIIKANFNSFVTRFELECGDIVNFGSAIKYSKKISIISSKLKEYGKSIEWTPAPATGGIGN